MTCDNSVLSCGSFRTRTPAGPMTQTERFRPCEPDDAMNRETETDPGDCRPEPQQCQTEVAAFSVGDEVYYAGSIARPGSDTNLQLVGLAHGLVVGLASGLTIGPASGPLIESANSRGSPLQLPCAGR